MFEGFSCFISQVVGVCCNQTTIKGCNKVNCVDNSAAAIVTGRLKLHTMCCILLPPVCCVSTFTPVCFLLHRPYSYISVCVCVFRVKHHGAKIKFFFLLLVIKYSAHCMAAAAWLLFSYFNKVKLKIHLHHYDDLGLNAASPEGAGFLLLSKNKGLHLSSLDLWL